MLIVLFHTQVEQCLPPAQRASQPGGIMSKKEIQMADILSGKFEQHVVKTRIADHLY